MDFGHNMVITPPEIPKFVGKFVPNTSKVQRLRVWFGKRGYMTLNSHFDLVRLLERAVRKAKLPVSFTGGFHPHPRISIATALCLGASSSSEIMDFELTQSMDIDDFQEKLISVLPKDIPIYMGEEISLKAPVTSQSLYAAEYILTITTNYETTPVNWHNWIYMVKTTPEIWWEHTTKSGKNKLVNLRDRLLELEVDSTNISEDNYLPNKIQLRYLGICRNDGRILNPEQLLFMLGKSAGREFQLLHIHRQRLVLAV